MWIAEECGRMVRNNNTHSVEVVNVPPKSAQRRTGLKQCLGGNATQGTDYFGPEDLQLHV